MAAMKRSTTIMQAQEFVRTFARQNGWDDAPNIDKFDHLHEELIEMSQHLRYKSKEERLALTQERADIFVDGIGDLFFGLCRLANQLNVDVEEAFLIAKEVIVRKYGGKVTEIRSGNEIDRRSTNGSS